MTSTATTLPRPRAAEAVRFLGYPFVVLTGAGLHLALAGAGLPLWASAYAAVALGGLAVAGLEVLLPARVSWAPHTSDLRVDAIYLALVQGALPVVLGLAAGTWIAGFSETGLRRVWPHAAPVAVQLLVMVLLADFLRYWLHVASHRVPCLWRLHAVHHEPEKLYWLNVGRFHPVEKTLQYLLDALPFALLGVSPEVLALYFVLYAIHGFFQHGNADVRLGWLNYLVSGPELHRWHHSRRPEESATNFGNNLIVWDLVFGTRFLPKAAEVASLGLDAPRWDFAGALLRIRFAVLRFTAWRRLVRAAERPRDEQRGTLMRILSRNRDTVFGKAHAFADIASVEEFRERVPVQSYEALRPYVDAQLASKERALTAASPVVYARTSGTTDRPKLVPIVGETLERLSRRQALSSFALFRVAPDAYRGRILAVVGPAVEEELPGGVRVGSASGHLHASMPALVRRKYVLPPEVFRVPDYELKYRLILRLAIAERNVTLLAAANPSTFSKLADVLRERRSELLADVRRETFTGLEDLEDEVRRAAVPRLRCGRPRVEELERVLRGSAPTLADVWPNIAAVATWTGGSAGFFVERLAKELPERALVCELGYLASELAGTIVVDPVSGLAVPTLQDHFFELVERESQESGAPVFRTLDEAEPGREYYVVVTTPSGLYRYFMDDIVRVTGRFGATPTLEFVQKGRGVTSITGEKLYEGQVLEAMRRTERALDLEARFFLLLADVPASRYRLFLETSSRPVERRMVELELDRQLAAINLEYRSKRDSGRLLPIDAALLAAGAGEAYKKSALARGQRESQYKPTVLRYGSSLDEAAG